ncbi:hypothetical protein JCM9279_001913 [Rhodotorula babjevae]
MLKSAALNAKLAAEMSLRTRQHPVSCQTTITVRSANGNSDKRLTHPETVRIMIAALQGLLENLSASGSDLGTDFFTFKVVSQPSTKPTSPLRDLLRIELSPSTRSGPASLSSALAGGARTTKFDPDRGNPGWFAATWERVVDEEDIAGPSSAQVRWNWYSREQGGERSVEGGKRALVTTFEEYDVFPPPQELAVDDHLVVSISASS